VAGIEQKVMKRVINSALLKPKEERTLDTDAFENQFRTSAAAAKTLKDSQKSCSSLWCFAELLPMTKTTVQVDMDEGYPEALTSFLMAYGIADTDEVKGSSS
jgi:hypothetical protein